MELMAACVAHQFPAGAAPTAETLARKMGAKQFGPAWLACLKAGRLAGVITDTPKNVQQPAQEPAQTAPQV